MHLVAGMSESFAFVVDPPVKGILKESPTGEAAEIRNGCEKRARVENRNVPDDEEDCRRRIAEKSNPII